MSLVSSLNVGVSSLRTYSEGIQVVSNNIANVNTVGYKASHAQYSDTFSNLLKPLVPNESNTAVKIAPTQIGGGVQIEAVAPVFSQGTIQATSSNSDLAIAGNGFFRVKNPQTGQVYVTRAGNFRVDADGYLVTQQGFRVQGAVAAKTKVFYDSTTGSYDVKGQQDNESVRIPSGLVQKVIANAKTVLGSATVEVDSTEGLQVGMPLSGPGVVTGSTIVSINQNSTPRPTFVMSAAGTSSQEGSSLLGNFKSLDSGSVTLKFPADYRRTDLVKDMVVSGPGIPTGTTIQTFSGNLKRTIPASTSSITLNKVTTTLNSQNCSAESVEGLAPGMILSAGGGITNGAVIVSVNPANNTFVIDIPATASFLGNLSAVASGGKTLSQDSNVLNLKNRDGLLPGMSVSGEGIPKAYIGEVSAVANIDSTFSVSLVDHPPAVLTASFTAAPQSVDVTVNDAPTGTNVVKSAYTVTVADTSGLAKGDSVTQEITGAVTAASWSAGSTTVTCASTAGLAVGDVLVNVPGIPFGAKIASITNGTTFELSTTARDSGAANGAGLSIAVRRTYGTVDSISSGSQFILKTSTAVGITAPAAGVFTAFGRPVYPSANSFSAVNLAFGDATVILSNRPTVDSFDDVVLSLGTYYTPASRVGDVKVSFDEGLNFDYYNMSGTKLSGIGLAAAQASGPKIRTFNVGTAGDINVILSNGQTFTAGNVLLMSFRDPGALTREGDNLFSGLYTAGPYNGTWDDANIANFTPSYKGLGSINGGALELSNVDIGEEFATMIITQRAFQAGSRVISTADQMLEEAVNLKR